MSSQPSSSKSAATAVMISATGGRDAALFGDVRKRSVAIVPKQLDGAEQQPAWAAVDRHAFLVTLGVVPGLRQLLDGGVKIIRREEIEMTVAVVIQPGAARALANGGLTVK